MYVKAANQFKGTLGFHNHKRLPNCFVHLVGGMFLDEDCKHIGFWSIQSSEYDDNMEGQLTHKDMYCICIHSYSKEKQKTQE